MRVQTHFGTAVTFDGAGLFFISLGYDQAGQDIESKYGERPQTSLLKQPHVVHRVTFHSAPYLKYRDLFC